MKTIRTILILLLFVPFCQSQNIQYRSKLRPIVKAKLDSLYPQATDVVLDQRTIHDNTQILNINCNCDKTIDRIILVFDTNGNLLNKEIQYNSIENLPDTIVSYMKKNTAPKRTFMNEYVKRIDKKGEISYGIVMRESATPYLLWFKPSGEFISREVMQGDSR
jgi:hypothetical protein